MGQEDLENLEKFFDENLNSKMGDKKVKNVLVGFQKTIAKMFDEEFDEEEAEKRAEKAINKVYNEKNKS